MVDSESCLLKSVFNICINLNDEILEKEKKNENLTFIDHYAFQASSYIISLIHNKVMINRKTICSAFILRSLIECMSLMKMYLAGKIPECATDLLNEYNYIVEYNIYKRYEKELDGKAFDFKQIQENYELTKAKYKDHVNLTPGKFKKLIGSKVPFLLDEYSFDEIIKNNCQDYYKFYRLLSVIVHPSDLLLTYPTLQNEDLQPLTFRLFSDFLDIVAKEYKEYNFKCKKTLNDELLLIFPQNINSQYLDYATKEKDSLYNIAEIIEKKFKENSMSYILKELGNSIEEMAIDKTFGFSEIVKCKFKPVMEILATYNYIRKLPHTVETKYLEELFTISTRINLMEIYEDNSIEQINKAFELYKNVKSNISYEDFSKNYKYTLGFIPYKQSFNQFVRTLIDDFVKKDDTLNAHMKMVYDESQFLSHANGYMISSNTGAFMEYSSVIVFVDYLTLALLDYYIKWVKVYNIIEGNGSYSKFIDSILENKNTLSKIANDKNRMDKNNNK